MKYLLFYSIIMCFSRSYRVVDIQTKELQQKKIKNHPEFRKAKNTGVYVIAHRGAHNGIPENSLPAYQKAIDIGCDFIEIDIRTTKDGECVSIHNSTIDEYVESTNGKVNKMTQAELKLLDIGSRIDPKWKNTKIPTFEEIVQLCQGKIGIYIDLKDASIKKLMTILKKYHMEQDVAWYLTASRIQNIKNINQVFSNTFVMPDLGSINNIGNILYKVNTSVIATDMDQLNKNFVATAHKYNTMVFADEKNGTKKEWAKMLKWKTDGIQTDNPEKLIKFLHQKNR